MTLTITNVSATDCGKSGVHIENTDVDASKIHAENCGEDGVVFKNVTGKIDQISASKVNGIGVSINKSESLNELRELIQKSQIAFSEKEELINDIKEIIEIKSKNEKLLKYNSFIEKAAKHASIISAAIAAFKLYFGV